MCDKMSLTWYELIDINHHEEAGSAIGTRHLLFLFFLNKNLHGKIGGGSVDVP